MRFSLAITAVLVFCSGCSLFQNSYRNFHDQDRREMMRSVAKTQSMGVGYDSTYQTDFVFYLKKDITTASAIDPALNTLPENEVRWLYLETYRIAEEAQYLQKHYQRTRKWTEFNYLENDITEPSKKLHQAVEGYFQRRYPAAFASIGKEKAAIRQRGILFQQEQETVVGEYR